MVSNCILKADLLYVNASSNEENSNNQINPSEKFQAFFETAGMTDENNDNSCTNQMTNVSYITQNQIVKNVLAGITNNITEKSNDFEDEINASENVMCYVNQIVNLIKDKFSLSDVELNDILQENNINATDLLTNDGLSELLTKLSPQENLLNLLTDSEFSDTVKEVFSIANEAKNNLMTQYNLESGDFENFLNVIKQNIEEIINLNESKSTDVSTYEGLDDVATVIKKDSVPSIITNTNVKASDVPVTDETISCNINNMTAKEKVDSNNDIKLTAKTDTKAVLQVSDEEATSNTAFSTDEESLDNDFAQTLFNKIFDALGETDNSIDSSEIIKQIVDEVKVAVKQDLSKMEMQLYPEHLGKVSLEVISKDGAVSAQLIVQSLAVKEALESNLPMLKENLENQGLKIDSVEVTVASHQFEQNLSDNGNRDNNNSNKRKKSINLQNIESSADIKQIDEILEEQKMQIDGNTVSYKA